VALLSDMTAELIMAGFATNDTLLGTRIVGHGSSVIRRWEAHVYMLALQK